MLFVLRLHLFYNLISFPVLFVVTWRTKLSHVLDRNFSLATRPTVTT